MSPPSCLRSSMLRSCKAARSGSLISADGSTCGQASGSTMPVHSKSRHSSRLILGIDRTGTARRPIGDRANIGYQRLHVRLAERVAPRRHERRFVERRAAVRDEGGEIGVADLVQSVALGERMRLDVKVVVIRDTLRGGLGVVAALAVLIVEMATERLLIAEGDLFDLELHRLMGLVGSRG